MNSPAVRLLLFTCHASIVAIASISQAFGHEPIYGFSHPSRSAQVATTTSGIIKEWFVVEGKKVTKNDPLAMLDDTLHQSRMEIAEAAMNSKGEIAIAAADLKLKEQRLIAIRLLAKKKHATPQELQRAESDAEVANAKLLSAREHQLQRRLEYEKHVTEAKGYLVTAPFSGVIRLLHKREGEFVGFGEPAVCELTDLSTLNAKFLLPDSLASRINSGDEATVFFPKASLTVEGTATLSPYPDAETGMTSVTIQIDNDEGAIQAGWQCQLQLQDD